MCSDASFVRFFPCIGEEAQAPSLVWCVGRGQVDEGDKLHKHSHAGVSVTDYSY